MILMFRPYKVGDYVAAQGEEGTIHEIQIFNTIILTLDNKTVIVPNGAMANGNITNFNRQEMRRVDFVVGIGYGDDYKKENDHIYKDLYDCIKTPTVLNHSSQNQMDKRIHYLPFPLSRSQ